MSGFKLISGNVVIPEQSLPMYKNAKSILIEDLVLSLECIVDLMLGKNKEEAKMYAGSVNSQLSQLNQFCPVLEGQGFTDWNQYLIKNLEALGFSQFNI
ncbi:hypothetical protein KC853_01315 [Candidatus Saccharibacteria bacterium]|nr:hypothetical protein [Candidatus Saccharibacteria bacterium]MCB9834874.1 hypothetical protein [Candidatus Nomurabacteria bacterium]